MNTTTLKGEGQDFGGNVKQAVGDATGDKSLQSEGIADQFAGNAKQIAGAAKEAFANPAPVAAKAKGFAKARPFAAAALFGVVGLAVLNTLRGK
ncbi:MAG: CsbD family protein [Oxalobacteraceae bacterium]|nr:MAG: CsbD family protein [Oxalobacteraceae bacterium]